MPEIKIMSIQNLLRIPYLKNSLKHAIIFVTTNPMYYDFGYTQFRQMNIADTNTPIVSDQSMKELKQIIQTSQNYDTIYVCCDAGLSRSPAVAHFLAVKLHEFEQAKEIEKKYRFLNQALYNKLMGVI